MLSHFNCVSLFSHVIPGCQLYPASTWLQRTSICVQGRGKSNPALCHCMSHGSEVVCTPSQTHALTYSDLSLKSLWHLGGSFSMELNSSPANCILLL